MKTLISPLAVRLALLLGLYLWIVVCGLIHT